MSVLVVAINVIIVALLVINVALFRRWQGLMHVRVQRLESDDAATKLRLEALERGVLRVPVQKPRGRETPR